MLLFVAKELPKGKTATELILENISEVEPAAGEVFAEGEATSVSWEDNEEEDSYETKKPKASEGEPKVCIFSQIALRETWSIFTSQK